MLSQQQCTRSNEATGLVSVAHRIRKQELTCCTAIRGVPEHSESGQFQVRAVELPSHLAPSLQTVPLELHDPEFRMRHRHADRIVNPSERDILFLRSALLTRFRAFMTDNEFTEVNTPLLTAGAGGAAARPFETDATEFSDMSLNLRIAPELFLKRLIVGDMQRVYELGPAFRNEGVDNTHNPEFTIAEFYGIMLRLGDLMAMTKELFRGLSTVASQASQKFESVALPEFTFQDHLPVMEFIPELGGRIRKHISEWLFPDLEHPDALPYLERTYQHLRMALPDEPTIPRLLDGLSAKFLEPKCQSPTWITNQPECMAPLARSYSKEYLTEGTNAFHRISARAELFIRGQEYVNCYEEENSPIEQKRKFKEQAAQHTDDESRSSMDMSYLGALEWGMPPTGGWGCGFDRIVMLFGGKSRIADVLPVGNLRNVVALNSHFAREASIRKKGIAQTRAAKRISAHGRGMWQKKLDDQLNKAALDDGVAEDDIGDSGRERFQLSAHETDPDDTLSYREMRKSGGMASSSSKDGSDAGGGSQSPPLKKPKSRKTGGNLEWLADGVPQLEAEVEDDPQDPRPEESIRRKGTTLGGAASFTALKGDKAKESM